jgi:hypothetical protein
LKYKKLERRLLNGDFQNTWAIKFVFGFDGKLFKFNARCAFKLKIEINSLFPN